MDIIHSFHFKVFGWRRNAFAMLTNYSFIPCRPKPAKPLRLLLSPPRFLFVLLIDFLAVKKFNEDLIIHILISDGVWLDDLVLNLEVLFCKLLTAVKIDIYWLLVLYLVPL